MSKYKAVIKNITRRDFSKREQCNMDALSHIWNKMAKWKFPEDYLDLLKTEECQRFQALKRRYKNKKGNSISPNVNNFFHLDSSCTFINLPSVRELNMVVISGLVLLLCLSRFLTKSKPLPGFRESRIQGNIYTFSFLWWKERGLE